MLLLPLLLLLKLLLLGHLQPLQQRVLARDDDQALQWRLGHLRG
jgi:hypothetical protein